jgi:hypothetical protein
MQENQSLRTRQDNDRPGQSALAAAGPSRSGNTAATTTNSLPADFGFQMINALKEVTAAAGANGARQSNLVELYPCQMTINEYYQSLPEPWDVTIPEYGLIKELHKARFTEQQRFSGDRLSDAAWRRRFLAVVHTQRMLVADKAVALSAALDIKINILSQVVQGLNYEAQTYATLIRELERLFGGAEGEISLASADLLKGLKSVDNIIRFSQVF